MPISVPKFIKQAWAAVGSKTDIPDDSDPLTGRAGFNLGFSPINMTPVAAGGIPPWGEDFNGILYDLSAAIQFLQAGRAFPFNQDFATAIGGYDKGALVANPSDLSQVYESTIDSNILPPPSAGWKIAGAVNQATELIAGIAKIATSAILKAGTNDDSFATAKGLKDAGLWPLGVGQSWQSFSDRSPGTTYTNSTGRPIKVSVTSSPTSSTGGVVLTINGLVVQRTIMDIDSSGGTITVSEVIPPGATYKAEVSPSLNAWLELR